VFFISYYFIRRESERQILYIGSIDFIKSLFKFERDLSYTILVLSHKVSSTKNAVE